MDIIHARCAGLDVHKQTVVACVRVVAASTARHEVRRRRTEATCTQSSEDPGSRSRTGLARPRRALRRGPAGNRVRGLAERGPSAPTERRARPGRPNLPRGPGSPPSSRSAAHHWRRRCRSEASGAPCGWCRRPRRTACSGPGRPRSAARAPSRSGPAMPAGPRADQEEPVRDLRPYRRSPRGWFGRSRAASRSRRWLTQIVALWQLAA